MKMSERGLEMLKQHEGLRLTAYLCPAQVWSIGYGHTGRVKPGSTITQLEADAFLLADVIEAERCVRRNLQVEVNQNQFDALVSLVFNIGCGAFTRSTLLKHLNAGDHHLASKQFTRWNRGGGKVLRGLTRRREAEQMLFREEVS